jgi:putative two-component system response regulator
MNKGKDKSILVVDDNAFVLESTAELLEAHGYSVVACSDAKEAIQAALHEEFFAVLTDVQMPGLSGIELLGRLREINPEVPVIIMTAFAELDMAVDAISKGAFDFIIKPYRPDYLAHSVKKAVDYYRLIQMEHDYKHHLEDAVSKRTYELTSALAMVSDMSREITVRMTAVSEFRDTDTGAHIKRIGYYSAFLASELEMSKDFIETIEFAATMHDIGKVGIADKILLKPGSLDAGEFKEMKTHTTIGYEMLKGSMYPTLKMAATIACAHHERWDGSGYPKGLKGDETPLEGRIVMLVDNYDALRSRRPYKEPFDHERAVEIMTEGSKRTKPEYFEPRLLEIFKASTELFDKIFTEHQD